MTVADLIAKLRRFPPHKPVVVQFTNDGEWGSFDARSEVRSVVWGKDDADNYAMIRCFEKHK